MRFMVFNIVPTLLEIAMVIGIFFFNYGVAFASITFFSVLAYILFPLLRLNGAPNMCVMQRKLIRYPTQGL